jgi:hypothetical protein
MMCCVILEQMQKRSDVPMPWDIKRRPADTREENSLWKIRKVGGPDSVPKT